MQGVGRRGLGRKRKCVKDFPGVACRSEREGSREAHEKGAGNILQLNPDFQ